MVGLKKVKNSTSIGCYMDKKQDSDSSRMLNPPLQSIRGMSKFYKMVVKSNGPIFEKYKSDENEASIQTMF